MPRKVIWTLLVVAVVAFAVFLVTYWTAPPAGIEAKGGGGDSAAIQYAALATSFVSLLTALVGLLKTVLDQRKTGGRT